jgi:LacI family transcriptional regulator
MVDFNHNVCTKASERPMPVISLKDVSQLAGCSVSTVSHILAGRGHRYSKEMRQQVEKAAQQLGYTPNQLARGLRSRKTFVVGLIVPEFFFRLSAIERRAAQCGYRMQMAAHHGDPGNLRSVISDFVARQVDGLFICYPEISEADLHSLVGEKPTVIVDAVPWLEFDSFVDDLRGFSELVTSHLLDLGHRKLAYLGPTSALRTAQERIKGFHETIADVPQTKEVILSLEGDGHPCELAERIVGEALKQWTDRERPTAIVASNCEAAVGAMAAVQKSGIRIPDDMSIVSITDQIIGRYAAVPVTAAADDVYVHVSDAMNHLLSRLTGTQEHQPREHPAARLVERGSSARLKKT